MLGVVRKSKWILMFMMALLILQLASIVLFFIAYFRDIVFLLLEPKMLILFSYILEPLPVYLGIQAAKRYAKG